MDDQIGRLRQDVQAIQTAMGLDIWTRRDVRRGFLGVVAGGAASLLLAIWMWCGGAAEPGLLLYLVALQTVVVLKGVGYSRNPKPSPGTQREVSFYNRYYFTGVALIVCYFFWGQRQAMDVQVLVATCAILAGMWYVFYALSAPSRSLSLAGAVPLVLGGLALPEAKSFSQMLCWVGLIGCIGCWFEATLLFAALRRGGSAASPSAPATTPLRPVAPQVPLSAHAAH
jgi:hypothetical protein